MKKLILSISMSLMAGAAFCAIRSDNRQHSAHLIGGLQELRRIYTRHGFHDHGPSPLIAPQLYYQPYHNRATKNYNELFRPHLNVTYDRASYPPMYPGMGMYGAGTLSMPPTLQSATFQLKNGLRITTYGEYDADGYKVRNPAALPWEKNNFNGAFEMKSENGNFGIRIGVQRGRSGLY